MDVNPFESANQRQSDLQQDLLDQIVSLKKQNANSAYQLLKTQKTISNFEARIKALEKEVHSLKNINPEEQKHLELIEKLKDLRRFI